MALLISTPIVTIDGILLNSAYVRIQAVDNYLGQKLFGVMQIYPSKESFVAGYQPLRVEMNPSLTITYDRVVNGTDTLMMMHDAFIQYLSDLGITATKTIE